MAPSRPMSIVANLALILSVFAWAALIWAFLPTPGRNASSTSWLIVACVTCLFSAGWFAGYAKIAAPVRSNAATALCVLLIVSGVWAQVAYG